MHIILLTETWLKSDLEAQSIHLPNYTHVYNLRTDSTGGGVSIFIHNNFTFEITGSVYCDRNNYLWIHINKLALHIGLIYKPPDTNVQKFLEVFTTFIERRTRCVVFGDFNINVLCKDNRSTEYLNCLKECGYKLLNKCNEKYCTRETSTTKTILDHISSNILTHSFQFTLIESSMSDHKQIYFEIKKRIRIQPIKRQYQHINYRTLHASFLQSDYSNKENNYLELENFIREKVNQNKTLKFKIQNAPRDDWITQELIRRINIRNEAWQNYKQHPNDDILQVKFTSEKNKVKNMINELRKSYYNNAFQKCKSKPKKMWTLISSLAHNKIQTSNVPTKLIVNSVVITNCTEICETFNNFFSTIGSTLANKIDVSLHCTNTNNTIQNITQSYHKLSKFKPCTLNEINKIIDSLDNNTSSGIDEINTKSLKCIKDLINTHLVSCINNCLEKGTFPDSLKIAKVSPIHKSGSNTDPGNYRPISVLPIMSKIFEKILYARIFEHLIKIDFLFSRQYGFRPKSSTLSAAIDLITKIKDAIDKNQIVLGIYIDLQKAFDAVCHNLLLDKLQLLFSDTAFQILQSYLQNRFQIVKINECQSQLAKLTFGVPQGSILGPLLFLIYINDLGKINLLGDVTLYADDTCLFYYGSNAQEIFTQAQTDLNSLNGWFNQNLLTINTSKTSYMLFAAKNKKIGTHEPLIINNTILRKSSEEKYLGIIMDSQLTWKSHITKIKKKLSSLLYCVRNLSNCIPPDTRLLIYNALVKPHIEYLIEIWGCAATTNLLPLQRAQNKLIKILFKLDYLTPTKDLYTKTKLLNIHQTYVYNTCLLIRKILNKTIHTQIQFKTSVPSKYIRRCKNTNLLKLSTPRTSYGRRNIKYQGAKLYNDLPENITKTTSIIKFKKLLKEHITTSLFYQKILNK